MKRLEQILDETIPNRSPWTAARLCGDMAIKLSSEEAAACRYLESVGLRFLVDFGYANAVDMAWDRLEYEPSMERVQ